MTFEKDVLTNWFEGMGMYWADKVRNVVRDADGYLISVDVHEEDGDWYTIDLGTIREGLAKVADPDFQINSAIRGRILSQDAGEMDVYDDDCLIQASVFGELVYG